MLNFEESEDKLVIRKTTSKLWIFGILLFILFWTWNAFSIFGVAVGILGVLSIAFIFVGILAETKDEIVINRKTRELMISRKGFFKLTTERQIYKFDVLDETLEFEKRQVGKSEEYFAYVKTLNNKEVELFDLSIFDERKFFSLFKLSNQYFIGLSDEDFQLPIN